ncbi:TAFII55 protein conserved region-domain-containing protein [Lentinula aciculospora]|uniref:TAFII55 protein conserved region-domain-containing protein n=1 Tax=Lentinula aciculospora TaxID=153920 RepID=A0A9W9AQR4_9AGAR|nr:TAFII55 protein conserved region-domain-containing protein [Lentinula aciculospora]
MYDDLIIVDDEEPQAGPSNIMANVADTVSNGTIPVEPSAASSPRVAAASTPNTASPQQQQQQQLSSSTSSPSDKPTTSKSQNVTIRTSHPTRKSTNLSNSNSSKPTKLKLKLSEKLAAQAPGMSFLGQYDRELDSDDDKEELAFEEQFFLRVPPGEDCDRLRKMVAAREVSADVWFKFKDSRRGIFHIGTNAYSSKLVDMPCIIESQKTLDNKQMFKVADICQMLVVENRLVDNNEDVVTKEKNLNIDDFIWPHGITPPLAHVRKRRFRKRLNKRTIETVEQEVERLLEQDNLAKEIKYEILENVNPDLSDSEFIEREDGPIDAPTPVISDLGDPSTPMGDEDPANYGDEGDEDEPDDDIDEELAAELDLALGDDEDDDDSDDDDDDDSDDDDDDDEEDEVSQARKLLNEEIRDLQAAVAKKGSEIASSGNPLIRKRFEDALKKLSSDLEMKLGQRDELQEKQLGIEGGGGESDFEQVDVEVDEQVNGVEGQEDDDLFGEEETAMDMD